MSTPGMPALDPVLFVTPYIGEWFQLLELGNTREQAILQRRAPAQPASALSASSHAASRISVTRCLGTDAASDGEARSKRGQRGSLLLFHGCRIGFLRGCSYARLLDQAAQAHQAHSDAALDGSQRLPQTLRQFGVSQAAKKCQLHYLALFRG